MKLRALTIVLALLCIPMLHAQKLQTVPVGDITAVIPSIDNFCTLLHMDDTQFSQTLHDYGYTQLEPEKGYTRYSNGTEQHPSYMEGLHMYLRRADGEELRCIVSLDIAPLMQAVVAMKDQVRSGYQGEMPGFDGYRIEFFQVKHQGQTYDLIVSNRPRYFEISLLKTTR